MCRKVRENHDKLGHKSCTNFESQISKCHHIQILITFCHQKIYIFRDFSAFKQKTQKGNSLLIVDPSKIP